MKRCWHKFKIELPITYLKVYQDFPFFKCKKCGIKTNNENLVMPNLFNKMKQYLVI